MEKMGSSHNESHQDKNSGSEVQQIIVEILPTEHVKGLSHEEIGDITLLNEKGEISEGNAYVADVFENTEISNVAGDLQKIIGDMAEETHMVLSQSGKTIPTRREGVKKRRELLSLIEPIIHAMNPDLKNIPIKLSVEMMTEHLKNMGKGLQYNSYNFSQKFLLVFKEKLKKKMKRKDNGKSKK